MFAILPLGLLGLRVAMTSIMVSSAMVNMVAVAEDELYEGLGIDSLFGELQFLMQTLTLMSLGILLMIATIFFVNHYASKADKWCKKLSKMPSDFILLWLGSATVTVHFIMSATIQILHYFSLYF